MAWLSRISRVARWTRQEWQLVAEAWVTLLWARVALRRWPLPAVVERLQGGVRPSAESVEVAPLVRAVARAARAFPLPMLCLPQSVALARMLGRRGQGCELVIGAKPQQGTLDAHAWVELDGQPVNSPPDSSDTHPVLIREAIATR